MEFKEKLKQLRLDKGLTQQELADSIYISRSMIAKYESGAAVPTIETIENLSAFFKVRVSDLLDLDNEIGVSYRYFRIFIIFHEVLFWITVVANTTFIAFSLIPFFGGQNLIDGAIRNSSYFVHITLAYCLISTIANFVWKYAFNTVKAKMILSIFLDFNILVSVVMMAYSVAVGIGGMYIY